MVIREKAKGRILPAHMPGGIDNPLGARALYIGASVYRIHGSNEPWSIGQAVSSGCIRLANEDIIDLYGRVKVGARVVVLSGGESKQKIAALAAGPSRKPAPPPPAVASATTAAAARVKDDSVEETTGSVAVQATPAPVAPETVPASAAGLTEASVKDDAVVPAPGTTVTADAAKPPVQRRLGH